MPAAPIEPRSTNFSRGCGRSLDNLRRLLSGITARGCSNESYRAQPRTSGFRLCRKLAREMAENDLLDHGPGGAIERTKGVKQEGVRAGNWLLKEG
jgi:hypothetical protein